MIQNGMAEYYVETIIFKGESVYAGFLESEVIDAPPSCVISGFLYLILRDIYPDYFPRGDYRGQAHSYRSWATTKVQQPHP